MPHPKILKILGMTAADWGQATIQGKRDELIAKANKLLAEEAANDRSSITHRLADLEERVKKLEAAKKG